MGTCSNCGKQNQESDKYCQDCGQKLTREKTMQSTNNKNKRWIFIPIIIGIIVVITAIVCVVVLKDSGSTASSGGEVYTGGGTTHQSIPPYSQPTQAYQPPTQQPHQVNLVEPGQILASGHYGYETATIQAGSTVTISWSADANVQIWILTGTQYPGWTFNSWSANYVAFKEGSSGTLTCSIANTDTYYLIISRPGSGLYSSTRVYSATASW